MDRDFAIYMAYVLGVSIEEIESAYVAFEECAK